MVDTAPGGLKYHRPVTQISTIGAASQSEKDDDHELLHHYSAQRFPETSTRTLSLLHYGSARCHHASSEPSTVRLLVVGQERRSEADWGRNGTMDLGEKRHSGWQGEAARRIWGEKRAVDGGEGEAARGMGRRSVGSRICWFEDSFCWVTSNVGCMAFGPILSHKWARGMHSVPCSTTALRACEKNAST